MSSLGSFSTTVVPGSSGVTSAFTAAATAGAAWATTALGRTMTHLILRNEGGVGGVGAVQVSFDGGTTTQGYIQPGGELPYEDVSVSSVSLRRVTIDATVRINAW